MTTICALCDAKTQEVWLGCNDGVSVRDTSIPGAKKIKWLQFGKWALAMAGSGVPFDILELNREHFPVDEEHPLAIVQYLKAVFDEFEVGRREDDDPATSYPITSLLAHCDGRIWDMDLYLVLDEVPPGTLWAHGTGREFALGADYPLASNNATAENRVRNSVEAAISYDIYSPGQAFVKKLI